MNRPLSWLNVVLPGAGLVLDGHLAAGIPLLLATCAGAALLALVALLGTADMALGTAAVALAIWAAAAALAGAAAWWLGRPPALDSAAIAALHREAAAAYLRGEGATALAAARRLAAGLPREAGAWRLCALAARAAGDQRLARRAQARAERLEMLG